MFHSLVHLNLQNSPDFPPFNKLFDILELSPNLQDFLFHHSTHSNNRGTASLEDIPKERSVKILSLSRIEFRAPPSVILLLIRHIIIPEGTKWSLKCSDVNIMLDKTFLSFLSSHSAGRTGLRCLFIGGTLHINLYEYDDSIDLGSKQIGELHMTIYSQDVLSSLRMLFGSEALLRVTSLELDYAGLSFVRAFYDNVLWHFPNVWHMTVNVSIQSISTQTISCFSDALATKAEDGSLPCPSLTHLVVCARINTTAAFEALVFCFRRRHDAQSPVQCLRIVDDTFQITGEDMKKITQYVPDVQIVKEKE
ncbi:hypothetical protein Clacol_002897 [Clathrus columnatus]|uniref:Uncharacterized protein n=1 Tax=Clathrus columnatus TaxID=1419009 RepID=A0AAV5A634_9AGAM|nr:hypothetical protein Clacol_002897 [Clathrus columnatus]